MPNNLVAPEVLPTNQIQSTQQQEEAIPFMQTEYINPNESITENIRLLKYNYCHVKKMIVFMMYTVRKMRNMVKQKQIFGNVTENMMIVACQLLTKGIILNKYMIDSLVNKIDIYQIKFFENFLQSNECRKILENY